MATEFMIRQEPRLWGVLFLVRLPRLYFLKINNKPFVGQHFMSGPYIIAQDSDESFGTFYYKKRYTNKKNIIVF